MNCSFISKYKPYLLADFCFSPSFVEVLRTMIDLEQLNLLLVGGVSSGKTTLLYALIREYYGLSKNDPLPENNLLFVNNLKEQGIQYFRTDMRTFCQSSSSIYGKRKIVIIDDIDIINEQSQQVFRNYIDKFSHNVCFISVCTNIQKVIESYQSRVHILQIPQVTNAEVKCLLDKIVESENLALQEEVKDYLLYISNHSIRVLINYLEKIHIVNPRRTTLGLDECKAICSNISFHNFAIYIEKVKEKDLAGAIQVLYSIHDYGYSVIDILDFFFLFVKTTSCLEEDLKYVITLFLCKYITAFHIIHEDCIELSLFTNNLISHIRQTDI
uniref:AAA+ ATPase domain-containing protein n=1 Tax=viral metagenome TaxID=1070528 RepID=A0A6C0I4L5_9ZZZZ